MTSLEYYWYGAGQLSKLSMAVTWSLYIILSQWNHTSKLKKKKLAIGVYGS